MYLFNTLTRTLEEFSPLAPPRVTLYTCGPTVWNYAHIGNFRTFVFEDVLRRYLVFQGYDVRHVMNLTDVDDRTINAANAAGKPLTEHTRPFTRAFFEDRDYLRILPAHHYPAATAYVPQMVALVERLLAKGVAYRGEDGSVYFAIAKFPSYGRLSRLDTREIKVGARVASDEYAKDDARDFVLWKAAKPEDEAVGAAWDAPFGRGRPGWHLECSAMSQELLGDTLDIHCGGVDLIFPHHEDEIAQSEAASGKPFARFWLHGEFLQIDGTKMSKRFGNFLTARDLRESGWDAAAIRTLFGQTHYRKQMNWTDEAVKAADAGARRLGEFRARLAAVQNGGTGGSGDRAIASGALGELVPGLEAEFRAAMDDDLDTPRALAAIQRFVRAANAALDRGGCGAAELEATAAAFDRVSGVLQVVPAIADVAQLRLTGNIPVMMRPSQGGSEDDTAWARGLAEQRREAKAARDFARADRLRDELAAKGFEVRDTKDGGYEVKRVAKPPAR